MTFSDPFSAMMETLPPFIPPYKLPAGNKSDRPILCHSFIRLSKNESRSLSSPLIKSLSSMMTVSSSSTT